MSSWAKCWVRNTPGHPQAADPVTWVGLEPKAVRSQTETVVLTTRPWGMPFFFFILFFKPIHNHEVSFDKTQIWWTHFQECKSADNFFILCNLSAMLGYKNYSSGERHTKKQQGDCLNWSNPSYDKSLTCHEKTCLCGLRTSWLKLACSALEIS